MSKKQLTIPLLVSLVGFPQISETIYTPALPNVAFGLQATTQLIESSLSIYFFGFAFGVLLWGTISDRCGRRKAMLLGLLIYVIGTVGCAQVISGEALLFWRFIQAFGASVGSVITQTIIRDSYEGTDRARLFSTLSGALALAPAIGPLIGGVVSEYLGWRANFWVLVLMGMILFIWSLRTLPETRPKLISTSKVFSQMMHSRTLWGHILLISATNGILFGFYQEAPFVFIEQLGMQPSLYGLFGLLIACATVVSARISYKLNGKMSSEKLIVMGTSVVLIGSCLFAFCISMSLLASASALFTVFLGIGLIIPNSLSHALKPYQASAGTAGSIFGFIYYMLIALFTLIMSEIHNGTTLPLPLYMIGLGFILSCGCFMMNAYKTDRSFC